MLADQPKVDTLYLSQLLKTAKQHKGKIIASNYNDKAGVPAIFPKVYFNQLKKLQGDKGAKQFLNQNSLEVIKCKPFNLVDIDTKEDYQNLTK